MALTTLLFDLDGTLLPFELDSFMRGYFSALVPRVAHLIDHERFVRAIWSATESMVRNEDPGLTNMDKFKLAFFAAANVEESEIWPIFEAFYVGPFDELRHLTQPSPISREICRVAVDKGYQLVLATNPIFPREAVERRMAWGGIGDVPFQLVTTMEDMHYCKPSPKYYMEITERLQVSPHECMMFGNDVQEDGVAGKLGMQTYLVDDFVIDRGVGHIEFSHRGSLADALAFVQALPVR